MKYNQKQATEYAKMAADFYRRSKEFERVGDTEQQKHYADMADYYWEMSDR